MVASFRIESEFEIVTDRLYSIRENYKTIYYTLLYKYQSTYIQALPPSWDRHNYYNTYSLSYGSELIRPILYRDYLHELCSLLSGVLSRMECSSREMLVCGTKSIYEKYRYEFVVKSQWLPDVPKCFKYILEFVILAQLTKYSCILVGGKRLLPHHKSVNIV